MTATAKAPAFDEQAAFISPGLNSISPTPQPTLDHYTFNADTDYTSDEWLSFPLQRLGSPSSVNCPPSPSPSVHSVEPSSDSTTSSSSNVNQTGHKRRLSCLDPSCTRRFANEYTRKVCGHLLCSFSLLPCGYEILTCCMKRFTWARTYLERGSSAGARVATPNFHDFTIVYATKQGNTMSSRSGHVTLV